MNRRNPYMGGGGVYSRNKMFAGTTVFNRKTFRQGTTGFGFDSNTSPSSRYRRGALPLRARNFDPIPLSAMPGDSVVPKKSFFKSDFFTKDRTFREASAGFLKGAAIPLELAIGAAFVVAGGITGAAEWGAPTGLGEDYVGGAVYGATKAAGSALGMSVGAFVGGTIGTLIPVPVIGTAFGSIAGSIVGTIVGDSIGGKVFGGPAKEFGMAARAVVRTSRAVDRIQFGGSFVDSRAAFTMRQAAVQEMSSSMLNARQYLGNEASFLHG